jgi:hypothetical protein
VEFILQALKDPLYHEEEEEDSYLGHVEDFLCVDVPEV